jgi:hypothetical protein
MRILAFIEDPEVIKRILKQLGLWFAKRKLRPVANAPPTGLHIDYSDSQIPDSEEDLCTDSDYAVESSAI